MQRVEGRLVARVGVNRRHEAVLDADGVVQHVHHGCEAVGGARGVRDDEMILGELVVVDAVDDRQVRAVGGSRHEHALGAGVEVQLRLVLRCEDAGALERDVDTEGLVRQLGRVLDRRHLDRTAAGIDGIAGYFDLVREAAVHAVEAEKVCVCLDGSEIVDRHDFDIRAPALDDRAQHVATDAAETVDRHLHCHSRESSGIKKNLARREREAARGRPPLRSRSICGRL